MGSDCKGFEKLASSLRVMYKIMDYGIHNSFLCQWNAFIRMIYLSYNIYGLNNMDGAALSPHVMFVGHLHVFLCHAN